MPWTAIYFVLFVVLGTTLPREVSSQESCSVAGDKDFEDKRLWNCNDYNTEKGISACHDLSYDPHTFHRENSSSSIDPGNYILVVFLDSLPVLILVPLILFFNINLASGTGHSIVFSTQVLVTIFSIHSVDRYDNFGISIWAMMVSGALVFFNTPLWIFWPSQTLAYIALGYVKVVLAVVIVVVYLGVATASQCPVQCCRGCWARLRRRMRHWREAHLAQRPLFTGACSVAILIYGSLLDVSFRLLIEVYYVNRVCIQPVPLQLPDFSNNTIATCYYQPYTVSNPPICWGSPNHRPYLVLALVIVTLSLLPPLLFFYHPAVPALVSFITKGRLQLPRLHKIKPVLDVFQGVYRPKMQFFAGLHLLYRVLLWFVAAYPLESQWFPSQESKLYQNSGPNFRSHIFLVVWLLILGIHGSFKPFESRRHNYLESLIMINISVIASMFALKISLPLSLLNNFYTSVSILPNLPLICVIVYYIYKLKFCCCRRRQNYQEIPEEQEYIEESFQGERLQPPDQAQLN